MSALIEILHRVSNKLTEVSEEIEVYDIMHEAVKEILPDVYFLVTKLHRNDMNFRIIHSFGFDTTFNAIQKLLGKNPSELDFPFNDLSEIKKEKFKSRSLYRFNDGIYDAVNGRINKTTCKAIEKILGISDVYSIGFVIGQNYFGGASFFISKSFNNSKGLSQDVKSTIENLASQVSSSINSIRKYNSLVKIKEDLRISNTRFNQLTSQLNDIVWKANGDGSGLIDLSNSLEKYYGYSSLEFEKNPNLWLDVVHPEDKNIAKKANEDLFKNGEAECEYRVIRPDGEIFWLHDQKSIVFDIDGNPIQMGGVATDITAKKNLEEELKLKNLALDKSPSAIGMADLNGLVFYVNYTFVKIWGYDNDTEIIGKHISQFSNNGNPSKEAFETIMKGEVFVGEDTSVRKDGTNFNYIVSASLVKSKQKSLCIMAVFVDNTKQKQLELTLKNNEKELIKLNHEKDKFFSIISHDLKNPFIGMLGLLKILANKYSNFSDEKRLKLIRASHSSAQQAFDLLSELLEWARLQNNKVEIKKEPIELRKIVNGNISLFLSNAEEKEIEIKNKIDENLIIILDENSIKSVVRNILINAIKFTQNKGSIEIDAIQLPNSIELSIKDTGVGMSEETINKLFKIDEIVTMPGTNNEKGTGLGLTICNDIVQLNGWKMNIDSELGKGTTFKILIPNS